MKNKSHSKAEFTNRIKPQLSLMTSKIEKEKKQSEVMKR
jgi:hypothetical protein